MKRLGEGMVDAAFEAEVRAWPASEAPLTLLCLLQSSAWSSAAHC